ncbi:hypothetical protein L4D13_09235 [Photobacterium profundum]|uniref:hypothetical protein n=1 Tax=Photobacterium profundum TaxID=74109 RepID=UPI003D0C5B77
MLDKFQSKLSKLHSSDMTAEAKALKTELIELNDDPKKMSPIFDYIDNRIQLSAKQIREEVEATMDVYAKKQRTILLMNIGIATFAVITFIVNKLL